MKFLSKLKPEKARIILFVILFFTLPFSFQCVNKLLDTNKPKAPQWQVPLNIGLIDRTFTFEQMIQKDPKFIVDSASGAVIYRPSSLVNQPSPITLPELNPGPSRLSKPVGPLQLDVSSISGVNIGAGQLFQGHSLPFTYLAGGSNFSLAMQQPVNNPAALYDYIVFENGQMTLSIKNNFLFTITFAAPGVQLVNTDMLADPALNDSVVGTFTFPAGGIAPGSTGTSTVPISGKTMSANLNLRFTVQSNDIQNKQINASDNLSAGMTIDGGGAGVKPTISKAKIQLKVPYPVVSIPDSAIQILDDSTKIKRAEFKDGNFTIRITNNVQTKIAVDFTFKELVDKTTGLPFILKDDLTQTDTVPAANSLTGQPGQLLQTVSMPDYAFQSQHDTVIGSRIDTLSVLNGHISLAIRTLAATQSKVVISETDSVVVDVLPQNNHQTPPRKTYVLEKVVGKVKPTPVPINETVDAGIGNIGNQFTADAINFDSVSIKLKILSTGSFPTDLTMKISGLDKNGVVHGAPLTAQERNSSGVLTNVLRINPGQEKDIVFDKTTSNGGYGIDQFLSSFFTGGNGSLPSKLVVTGQAVVDPASYYQYPDSTGTVQVGDSVFTSVDFSFPVHVGIINGIFRDTVVITDTSGNKIDKKDLAQIDSGNVIFTIFNGFPLQITVGSKLLPGLASNMSKPNTDTNAVLLSLPKTGVIQADSARYASTPPTNSPIGLTGTIIPMSTSDVGKINPARFVAVKIVLNTSGSNAPVEFKKEYYVRLKAFVSVRYNVNIDTLTHSSH